jgi:hypothetical protein
MTRAPYDNEPIGLRDYFAAKAPMPNAAEASSILGWKCRESVPRSKPSDVPAWDEWTALPSFDELWKTLSNQERLRVCAKFQFMYADAMLAARQPPSPPAPTPDVEELCDE